MIEGNIIGYFKALSLKDDMNIVSREMLHSAFIKHSDPLTFSTFC
jgi:hypothetical protein